MYIDDTISTVKSLVGFTDVTDICRPVMYTEFNTLIVEIKNLSMEVNFMDSSDGLGRSKNNIGADIQVSIVLAGIVDSVRGRIHHRTVLEVQCRHIKEYRLTPCCICCAQMHTCLYIRAPLGAFFVHKYIKCTGFRPFLSWSNFLCFRISGFWRTTYVYFMWKMLSEMRKERNGDEYKEIRRASGSIEKP